jgi:3-oxoadipate enol-lactonase
MKIKIGDIEFGYDRAGSGDPVLLVMGLGTPRIGWFHQFSFLSQTYDVTSFDNRGVGETVAPGSWTIHEMAADAIGLADSMGYERFHLVGISMGGMISQEVALNYPDRVRSLTLMATSPGGPESEAMRPEFAAALAIPDPAERVRKTTEATFGAKFRRENPAMMEIILSAVAAQETGVTMLGGDAAGSGQSGFLGQVTAVVSWMMEGGTHTRLKDITAPTLVLHGGDDLLLPIRNGEIIARDVPGARSRFWPDAGHALNVEYADEVNAELIAHFQSASARV